MATKDLVRILPLSQELLPVVNAWRKDPDFGGPFDFPGEKRDLTESDIGGPYSNHLIEYDGVLVGDIQFHEVKYGPNEESTAANMGISLMPEFRGKGIGAMAQRLFSEQLLEKYQRVEAQTDVENVAEQRALEKAGFTREGILRMAQYRDGYHDLISYSRIRSDLQ